MTHEPIQINLAAGHMRHAYELVVGGIAGCAGVSAGHVQRLDAFALSGRTVARMAPYCLGRVKGADADDSYLAVLSVG